MEPHEPLLREAGQRSEYLRPRDLVSLVERHVGDGNGGVTRAAVDVHVEALAAAGSHVDADSFDAALTEATTRSRECVDDRAVCEVADHRPSAYPAAWHASLDGTETLPELVRFLVERTAYTPVEAGAGDGVPEADLLDVAATVADYDRQVAKAELENCREAERLVQDADQHPEANVYLPEGDHGQRQDPDHYTRTGSASPWDQTDRRSATYCSNVRGGRPSTASTVSVIRADSPSRVMV
jgi:hypothetical protein